MLAQQHKREDESLTIFLHIPKRPRYRRERRWLAKQIDERHQRAQVTDSKGGGKKS